MMNMFVFLPLWLQHSGQYLENTYLNLVHASGVDAAGHCVTIVGEKKDMK